MTHVALTFDDGPSEWTEPILDALAAHGATATFFVIGAFVDGREALVRRMTEDGHDVGNHTFDHVDLQKLEDDEIAEQLRRCSDVLETAMAQRPRLFRAPYFRKDARVLAAAERAGFVDVGADVYPLDWDPAVDADLIVERVLATVGPRSVVCLHDGIPPRGVTDRVDCEATVEAVRRLLPALAERGYECVSVSDLLSRAPRPTSD